MENSDSELNMAQVEQYNDINDEINKIIDNNKDHINRQYEYISNVHNEYRK